MDNISISLPIIPASSMEFLKSLKQNNNRDWFNAHKNEYAEQRTFIEAFADGLLHGLNIHDLIETQSGKKSLHRIYKDTRFSKEKIPYKTNWSGNFTRATKQRRGGYFFRIEPGNTFIAGGFQAPNAQDLKRIREDLSSNAAPFREIINNKSFVSIFQSLQGEQLKTTPKGFDANSEAIDLLRYKQFILKRKFTDEEVLAPSFMQEVNKTFQNMRPFFDYMSEVLTTDNNGLSL